MSGGILTPLWAGPAHAPERAAHRRNAYKPVLRASPNAHMFSEGCVWPGLDLSSERSKLVWTESRSATGDDSGRKISTTAILTEIAFDSTPTNSEDLGSLG